MEADDHEPSAGEQQVDHLLDQVAQPFEFVVYGDPQRLKGAGGRVDLAGPARPQGPLHDVSQLGGGGDAAQLPHLADPPGDAAGVALLAVGEDQVGQLLLRQAVHELGGGDLLGLVHPHVQRALGGEGEAPLRVEELEGGDTQVQEQPVDGGDAQPVQDEGQVLEIVAAEGDLLAEAVQPGGGQGERLLVAVHGHQAAARRQAAGDQFGVAAVAHGAVHVKAVGILHQMRHGRVRQDGPVLERWFGVAGQ